MTISKAQVEAVMEKVLGELVYIDLNDVHEKSSLPGCDFDSVCDSITRHMNEVLGDWYKRESERNYNAGYKAGKFDSRLRPGDGMMGG